MTIDVDLRLFNRAAHNPSFASLMRSVPGEEAKILDFCVPCNPYFPTPAMFAEYAAALTSILKHYPSDNETIARRLADTLDLNAANLVLANGSTELISWIDTLLIRSSIATPVPTFGRWTDQPAETGKRVHLYPLRAETGFRLDPREFARFVHERGARAAVICNPNNPDGGCLRRAEVLELLDRLADLDLVVVDESFIDFVVAEEAPSVGPGILHRENVIVLKSLGKNFGLHGVRFGYALCHTVLAKRLRQALPPWNVNGMAEAIIFSLADNLGPYRDSLARLAEDRHDMYERLQRVPGVVVYPSEANFILVKLLGAISGVECRNHLLAEHGIFVRECGNKLGGGSAFVRLAVRPRANVNRLIAALADFLFAKSSTVSCNRAPANWSLPSCELISPR